MRFSSVIPFIGAAAALPSAPSSVGGIVDVPQASPKDIKIIGVSAIGSGFPVGHAFVTVDATGTIFDVAFDQYYVAVGPGSAVSDARKNCRVSINLQFPEGLS